MNTNQSKYYSEGATSTVTHNGNEYKLDTLFRITASRSVISIPVSKLKWVMEYTKTYASRVDVADLKIPILVYEDKRYGLTVLDGAHRLAKAIKNNQFALPVIMVTDEDLLKSKIVNSSNLSIGNESAKAVTWDPKFAPSYTPEEMLKLGVFEGKYINAVKGVPAAWKKIPKVLKPDDEPDPTINKYGVKSRQPLSVWKKNGWIKTDKLGFFEWMINYFLGRRLGDEDDWQIGRWNSFVARHQGQITAKCNLKDDKCNAKQRQGLLQWGWDSNEAYTDKQKEKNAKRIARIAGVPLAKEDDEGNKKNISQESLIAVPNYMDW